MMLRAAGLAIGLLSSMLVVPAVQSGLDAVGAQRAVAAMHGGHFQDAELSMVRQSGYPTVKPARDNDPDLIADEETVSTLAVGTVLAVEKKDGRSRRASGRDWLVERFLEHVGKLRQPPDHTRRRKVAICASLDGWTRFPPAEQWLKNYRGDGPLEGWQSLGRTVG